MGFFSFLTNDTKESIPNSYSNADTFVVYMQDNNGNVWVERNYEGYGVFGDKDYYELASEMNGFEGRKPSIKAYCNNEADDEWIWPSLSEYPDWKWNGEKPEPCPDQGFFYD